MVKEQELSNKNEYFEYVESRIENLEKLILKKDEELKSLILQTTTLDASNSEKENPQKKVLIKGKGNFDQVFNDIKEKEECFLKKDGSQPAYKKEELNDQLVTIENREKKVQEMLDSLGTALLILKQRHEEVNRKEETLNREYLKLKEIEAMYYASSGIDNLSSTFGQIAKNNENTTENKKTLIRKNSKE
jgi:hypothetical protein